MQEQEGSMAYDFATGDWSTTENLQATSSVVSPPPDPLEQGTIPLASGHPNANTRCILGKMEHNDQELANNFYRWLRHNVRGGFYDALREKFRNER